MNEPAFPHVADEEHDSGYHATDVCPGMSIRDFFAAHALTGILSSCDGDQDIPVAGRVSMWAYQYADAMLAERNKPCDS